MKSVDAMALEVLQREGTKLVIHPDQVRMWQSKGPKFADEFNELRRLHAEKYEGLLADLIQQSSGTGSQVVPTEEGNEEETPERNEPEPTLTTFESLDKLAAVDPVACKCASEIAGVELIRTTSKKIFLFSEKQKAIPRHAIIGGFGTGKSFDKFYFLVASFCGIYWVDVGRFSFPDFLVLHTESGTSLRMRRALD